MPNQTYLALQAIQQSKGVRAVLERNAQRIAERADFIARQDRLSSETDVVHVTSGTRPQGRSYSEVGVRFRTREQAQNELAQALGLPARNLTVTRAVSGARQVR